MLQYVMLRCVMLHMNYYLNDRSVSHLTIYYYLWKAFLSNTWKCTDSRHFIFTYNAGIPPHCCQLNILTEQRQLVSVRKLSQ